MANTKDPREVLEWTYAPKDPGKPLLEFRAPNNEAAVMQYLQTRGFRDPMHDGHLENQQYLPRFNVATGMQEAAPKRRGRPRKAGGCTCPICGAPPVAAGSWCTECWRHFKRIERAGEPTAGFSARRRAELAAQGAQAGQASQAATAA